MYVARAIAARSALAIHMVLRSRRGLALAARKMQRTLDALNNKGRSLELVNI